MPYMKTPARVHELTAEQAEDMRDFGFEVELIAYNLYLITFKGEKL